ncbi:MAG: methylamine utilization protein [Terrimicrobiaceae bacterium]|nr:methylamine utilization protein [Terrimicrobiaceae bacterium]
MAALVLGIGAARAADVTVLAKDDKGRAVPDAAVWVEQAGKQARPKPVETEIVQNHRQFIPRVTVIPVGSSVQFPNRDTVQHHVYSFSPARTFELPLYIGESPRTINFDQAGVVTLGCNIHDWMSASIVVVNTPFFAVTDAGGRAVVRGVPGGDVVIHVWHPRLRGEAIEWRADLSGGSIQREAALKLRPEFRRTPPDADGGTYR